MLYEKESCGSVLKIHTFDNELEREAIQKIEKKLMLFEEKYSRFFSQSFLNLLNRSGKSSIDEEFKTLFRVCKKLYSVSDGYFDITILPFLENLGYGIENKKLSQNYGMNNIEIIDDQAVLKNQVKIDFGSIGKGYMVDFISQVLKNKMKNYVIDFGGDIKVGKQREKIGLEDPFDTQKIIGEIIVTDASICASNGQKRKFGNNHHLINPFTKMSQNDKICVYVKHTSATLADGYSTALFVSPLDKALEILETTVGLEGCIIAKNGEIYKTNGFDCIWY